MSRFIPNSGHVLRHKASGHFDKPFVRVRRAVGVVGSQSSKDLCKVVVAHFSVVHDATSAGAAVSSERLVERLIVGIGAWAWPCGTGPVPDPKRATMCGCQLTYHMHNGHQKKSTNLRRVA